MIKDIWHSFRGLPGWVQAWVAVILVPVNLASVLFWAAPHGGWIALMAVGAMALNLPIMLVERGFSKAMALPHIVIWPPLCAGIAFVLIRGVALAPGQQEFLVVLLAVDLVSLVFDFPDALRWWRGERETA